jgi:radical SAM superfamily enzyme YgiQ (UPF0313 family)
VQQAPIVLATINAKYAHTAFGLRCLYANMGALQPLTLISEFTLQDRPTDIVEKLLAHNPRIIGWGVYIWNTTLVQECVALIKTLAPDVVLVLGGPEVSHETEQQPWTLSANHVIQGEGEISFPALCKEILENQSRSAHIIQGVLPQVETMAMPYDFYTEQDIQHRVVYVEASRGCPYQCEFCLSSLDQKVRKFPLDVFLQHMDALLKKGVRQFKFIDRTFNLHIQTSTAILAFFLDRYTPDLFVHFEMVPDRLPEALRSLIAQFPAGALQFEIGIQTFNPETSALISRKQDLHKLQDNLAFLRTQTGVHLHTDLIVGLPAENIASFAEGFNKLVALQPQEIQVGILKRLKGTPISRHTEAFGMVYNPYAPYDVLCNHLIPFTDMQKMKRFARYWDIFANSGQFLNTVPLLWAHTSPFEGFMQWSEWLYETTRRTHGIALDKQAELLWQYLTRTLPAHTVQQSLAADYQRGAVRRLPHFLQTQPAVTNVPPSAKKIPKRQALHMA